MAGILVPPELACALLTCGVLPELPDTYTTSPLERFSPATTSTSINPSRLPINVPCDQSEPSYTLRAVFAESIQTSPVKGDVGAVAGLPCIVAAPVLPTVNPGWVVPLKLP